MAGLYLTATNSQTTFTSGTPKSLLSIVAGSNDRLRVLSVTVSMNGTSATDPPVLITLCSQPPAGGTTTALGANYGIHYKNPTDSGSFTSQTTATAWSTEPTVNTIIKEFYVHPQTSFTYIFPTGQEVYVSGTSYFGVRATVGASFTPTNITCDIDFEE